MKKKNNNTANLREINNSTQKDKYLGKELEPFSGRPGAMDAYKLPSLISGVRVYRK